jgi:hypothetical protein
MGSWSRFVTEQNRNMPGSLNWFQIEFTYLATFGAGFAGGWGIKAARGHHEE